MVSLPLKKFSVNRLSVYIQNQNCSLCHSKDNHSPGIKDRENKPISSNKYIKYYMYFKFVSGVFSVRVCVCVSVCV